MNTANYTKGQKQALLESLTAQFNSASPMTKAERNLLAELTKETLRKNVMTKLNNISSKLSAINERVDEIENEEFISKSDKKELEKLQNEYQKINDELSTYLIERNVTEDEFYFSELKHHFDGCTFDEVKGI